MRQTFETVMLSKRACVYYLEKARVFQRDENVVYSQVGKSGALEFIFNIPDVNTSLLLLGKGCSITDAAARMLGTSNVMIGFCGTGGTPLHVASDFVFLSSQSEYRPTEYMQKWARNWFDNQARLECAKELLRMRVGLVQTKWIANQFLLERQIGLNQQTIASFSDEIESARSHEQLLLAEARWSKSLYSVLAKGCKLEFSRQEGQGLSSSKSERVNSFLDHGNYLAYGLAAVTLHGLGISFAFALLHGKTRRGGAVFDIADLIKDSLVMPYCFEAGQAKLRDQEFRQGMIERLHLNQCLDLLFDKTKAICEKCY